MPRVRPTEHRAVVKLLNEEAESVEDLAAEVIIKIDELRATRKDYVVAVRERNGFVHIYGPYITKNAADRDVGKHAFGVGEGAMYMVLPLYTDINEGIEGIDD